MNDDSLFTDMKLCPYCSKEMELSALVCTHCGHNWKTGAGAAPQGKATKRQWSPSDWAWWCLAALLLSALIGGYYALIPVIH